jgi:hypothetical protein
MKKTDTMRHWISAILCFLMLFLFNGCVYLKMVPPPDVDKNPFPPATTDNSCWMATASNMLAGAGYGNGVTVQQRADDIYADMVAHYGTANRGWHDTAITWWLNSNNNTWPNNPYTVVTVLGTKSMNPWTAQDAPERMGDELRKCAFLGVAFSWPTASNLTIGEGGHATTDWGDNWPGAELTFNPSQIKITDSDREGTKNEQTYDYDSYSNPNPGGPNEGNGWYFDYSSNHPYLRCAISLSPTDELSDNKLTQKVIGSYRIHQANKIRAIDLHYNVGTDINILSYRTELDWDRTLVPDITEGQPNRTFLLVDWDLKSKPVPHCTWVTITTEFILPNWNAISYKDVYFTYPKIARVPVPSLRWSMTTPTLERTEGIPDITGGYVIGAFNILSTETDEIISEYRFIHQYSYTQSPELHTFTLEGDRGFYVADMRFGHDYGFPSDTELWNFTDWMTRIDKKYRLDQEKIELKIDWSGRLPYPRGMDVRDVLEYIREKQK